MSRRRGYPGSACSSSLAAQACMTERRRAEVVILLLLPSSTLPSSASIVGSCILESVHLSPSSPCLRSIYLLICASSFLLLTPTAAAVPPRRCFAVSFFFFIILSLVSANSLDDAVPISSRHVVSSASSSSSSLLAADPSHLVLLLVVGTALPSPHSLLPLCRRSFFWDDPKSIQKKNSKEDDTFCRLSLEEQKMKELYSNDLIILLGSISSLVVLFSRNTAITRLAAASLSQVAPRLFVDQQTIVRLCLYC